MPQREATVWAHTTGLVPSTQAAGSDYKIRVTSTSNSSVTDTSDNFFTVLGPSVTVTSPNGGDTLTAGTTKTITWNYTGDPGYFQDRTPQSRHCCCHPQFLCLKGKQRCGLIQLAIPSTQAAGSDYKIRVTSTSNSSVTDTSDNFFTVLGPSVTVTSPNGGDTLTAGTTKTITWNYTGDPGYYLKIELLKAGTVVATLNSYALKGSNGMGSYNWLVPSTQAAGANYSIKITSISTVP